MAVSGLGYTAMEQELKTVFETAFDDRLGTDTCQIADLDKAHEALMGFTPEEYNDMLVFDFAGGTDQPRKVFANIKWAWIASGVYMIRYHDEIEQALRIVVGRIPTVFQENRRLNGTTDLAYITEIGDPAIGKINDVSFYFIPFFVEMLDRSVQL